MNGKYVTQKQIVDITWKYDEKTGKYDQTIKLYDHATKQSERISLQNYTFNWVLSEERFCPGYYDLDGWHSCPHDSILLKPEYQQCYFCDQKQGFKAAFLYGKEPNEHMQQYLSKPHFIYLAFFTPDIVKVGTAAASRKFIRPIEQDALIYGFIAESDGFTIQQLEHTISSRLKLTESVRSSVKFKNLHVKPNSAYVKNLLTHEFKKIKQTFEDHEVFGSWLFSSIDIVDLTNLPELLYPQSTVYRLKQNEILHIHGQFRGIRGRYTIFENQTYLYAVDEREIIGRYIADYEDEYSYIEPKQKLATDDQMTLL